MINNRSQNKVKSLINLAGQYHSRLTDHGVALDEIQGLSVSNFDSLVSLHSGGTFDASTGLTSRGLRLNNSLSLKNAIFSCTVAGSWDLGGITTWKRGDLAISTGDGWIRVPVGETNNSLTVISDINDLPRPGDPTMTYLDNVKYRTIYWDPDLNDYVTSVVDEIGTMYSFTGTAIPSGFLSMEGQSFSISDYSLLHSWLSANWSGYVSGIMPDMRDMHVRGRNSSRAIGSYEADALQQHGHSASGNLTSINLPNFSTATVIGDDNGLYRGNRNFGFKDPDTSGGVSGSVSVSVGNITGAATASETRVKNKAVIFIMKALYSVRV